MGKQIVTFLVQLAHSGRKNLCIHCGLRRNLSQLRKIIHEAAFLALFLGKKRSSTDQTEGVNAMSPKIINLDCVITACFNLLFSSWHLSHKAFSYSNIHNLKRTSPSVSFVFIYLFYINVYSATALDKNIDYLIKSFYFGPERLSQVSLTLR